VGMGSPLQERWVWRHLRDVPGATVITVGGLFDFFSGRIPRAPVAWREMGVEWLFRLRQEPARLARRDLLGNPLFLAAVVAQPLRASGSKEVPAPRAPGTDAKGFPMRWALAILLFGLAWGGGILARTRPKVQRVLLFLVPFITFYGSAKVG